MTIDQDLFLECYQSAWFERLCGRMAYRSNDYPDVRQEAAIALLYAMRIWDPERGVPLKHFACIYIRRRVLLAMQRWRSVVRMPGLYSVRTSELDEDAVAGDDDKWLDHMDQVRLAERMADLGPGERRLLDLLFREGMQQFEAAQAMGVSRQRVGQLWKRAAGKIAPPEPTAA